ncbi:BTAD domain-containing putative transcriptional regulator [Nocardia sp. NBC_01388]|uniref:BTAD domain-containing putative transcriptional regulator n=1 Tax=Nocardia sp. NBC_01388 TaxID=2903596 RepID=UPI00324F79A2
MSRVQIGMLGPLVIRADDGGAIEVPGARLRALLIALGLEPGRAVSKAKLVDWIWGEQPPADAANALQALVSRLRRVLPDGSIEVQAGGYRLTVEPHAVDAVRFEELLDQARGSADPRRAQLLREALELWRGTVMQDVGLRDSEAFDAVVTRLEGLHLAALEDRYEVEIRLGRGAELVAELTESVARHPVRERLAAALMRALGAAGRGTEALQVYQRAREALADELGVDPSPELSALHVALLRGELDAPEPTPATEEVRKTNLRAELTTFVGKSADVAAVAELVAEHRLTTLSGPGGSGKTRLAVETAQTLLGELPDGAWLVELAPIGASGDVAQATLAALGLREALLGGAPDAEPMDRLIAAFREREALLILDNCEHVIEAAAKFAHRLLGECRQLRILATSREPLGITGEALWQVEPLALPAADAAPADIESSPAVQLLQDRAGAVSQSLAADAHALSNMARICRALDGIPLAIELAAARLRTMSLDQLANRLDDRFRLLTGGSRTAIPQHRTLRAVVDWSWELLTDAERTVLRRLSVFAGGASLDAAEQVCAGDALWSDPRGDASGANSSDLQAVANSANSSDLQAIANSANSSDLQAIANSANSSHLQAIANSANSSDLQAIANSANSSDLQAIANSANSSDLQAIANSANSSDLQAIANSANSSDLQAVASGAVEQWEVLELLTTLTEKSLLRTVASSAGPAAGDSAPRYRMLETIKEYARERLTEAGESESARRAHLAYFTELAATADPHLRRAEQLEWLATLAADHDNIAAALRAALAAGDATGAMRLAAAAGWYWWLGGHKAEGMELIIAAAEAPGEVDDDTRAMVYTLVVHFVSAGRNDEFQVEDWIHRAHHYSRDSQIRNPLLGFVGALERMLQGPDAFLTAFEPLLTDEDPWVRALARLQMGKMRIVLGRDTQDVDAYLEQALAEFRAIGERWGMSFALTEVANRIAMRGEFRSAIEHFDQAIAVVTEAGALEDVVQLRARQAQLYWLLDDAEASAAAMAEAQRCAQRCAWPNALAELALAQAELARWSGDTDQVYRQIDVATVTLDTESTNIRAVTHDLLGYVVDSLEDAREHRVTAFRAASETGYAPLIAQVLIGIADQALRGEQYEQAARLLAASTTVRGLPDRSHPDAARIEQATRESLGEPKFAEAMREGAQTSWHELIETTLAC